MGDIMRPVPFPELLKRMFAELRNEDSIFGLGRRQFFEDDEKKAVNVFGQVCSTPCGPAAGPHTQLAQNIITAYLAGGRFIELKTVQIMDTLDIDKPCIDARDEGYNVEWSTEYTLPKAFDEYLKAWIAVHLLQALLRGGRIADDRFIFNMSVGYNLEGIKQPRMQDFINNMMDASGVPAFKTYIAEMEKLIAGGLLDDTPFEALAGKLGNLGASIDSHICRQVTISTMHGCPPKEIEAICTYMLSEKGLNTFVKLNPTLLGYDAVREILDKTGFAYVGLRRESFEKDLQYSDALAMLHRLKDLAASLGLGFGVKLTNTLGSVNDQGQLPGAEMYMSGRALLPISTRVGALLSKEFAGKLPISYSGGANIFSVKDLFDTGIRPITLATDMLKPGGYSRMTRMIELLIRESKRWDADGVDPDALRTLSERALTETSQQKEFRGKDRAKSSSELEMFDCFTAPCQDACPIHQDAPDYVYLAGRGMYAEALELIYEDNALPNITCAICDHQCQKHCSRMDYEGAVKIRDMKKVAVEKGSAAYYAGFKPETELSDIKAAVVGAGPAGLSAAYFLARAGFRVTVLERAADAGGVVKRIIPEFRIPASAVQADIDHIMKTGVEFRFNVRDEEETVQALKNQGFDYVFYAVGTPKDNFIKLDNEGGLPVVGALEFLSAYAKDPTGGGISGNIVICGGGNTAMDCARAALRLPCTKSVTVVYRRSSQKMPADREEYQHALAEGTIFRFLSNPKAFRDGMLECSVMELGEADASGRRSPVETGGTFVLDCSLLITATGERCDSDLLESFGLPLDEKRRPVTDRETMRTPIEGVYLIGDAQSGPSTVVRCIASARAAVEDAIDTEFENAADEIEAGAEGCVCSAGDCGNCDRTDCDNEDCGCGYGTEELSEEEREELLQAEQAELDDIHAKKTSFRCSLKYGDKDFESNEAHRCLDCPYVCGKCVEVCPNRANVSIDVRGCDLFEDPFQIVHLDAYCNECGNCAVFCNHQGRPYRDKFTIFSRKDDFESSQNSGMLLDCDGLLVRTDGEVVRCTVDDTGAVGGDIDPQAKALIEIILEDYDYLLGRVEE